MKTKVDRKIWLSIGIAIIIVAVVMLARTYAQQASEQEELKAKLEQQETLLHTLATQESEQQKRLTAAESLFEASRAKFPESVDSIEYGEDFFKIAYGQNLYGMAAGCGVELTTLTASQPVDRAAGAVVYAVSSFEVQVQGTMENVLKFIDAIGTGIDYELPWSFQLPWSVAVKSIRIDFGDNAVASISLDIYGYKG